VRSVCDVSPALASIRQRFRVSSGSDAVPRSTLACVNENRPVPPPWAIAGGVVAALALIFLLGFAIGQQPDWHIGEWHWGNIFTVTVASIAIIASCTAPLARLDLAPTF
jgi:hypothetical protein